MCQSCRCLLLFLAMLWAVATAARGNEAVVHNFSSTDGTPAFYGSVILSGSVLYGMTSNGGSEMVGSIFSVNADGSGYTDLHDFTNDGLQSDGASPLGSLTLAGIVSFTKPAAGGTVPGAAPVSSVSFGTFLYGMTQSGGIFPPSGPPANGGTVFRLGTDGSGFQILHGFTGSQVTSTNDGATPFGGVVVSGTTIYGMTRYGGTSGGGTIFSMQNDGSNFQLLHSFAGGTGDGMDPQGTLTLVGSTLYGLTHGGGANGEGTIFSINTDGSAFTLLHSFGVFDSGDAEEPSGGNGLTAVGSTLYGVTYYGGGNGMGAIFSINTDGSAYTLVHSLDASDGGAPSGALTSYGTKLYGMSTGLNTNLGSVFGMDQDGSNFTTVHSFAGSPEDGRAGIGNPVVSSDGTTLYGMTEYGGTSANGVIFSTPTIGNGPSSNAMLSGLVLSAGSYTYPFAGGTTRYTAYVPDTTASTTITPTTADASASVTVNGTATASGAASSAIPLCTGSNIINVIVTAGDGVTTSIYTVAAIRMTTLQNWRLTYLGTEVDVGDAANTGDFNGNGIPNVAKYAFALDPTSPASNQIPQPVFNAGNLGFSFTEPSGVSEIVYGAEWTQSLNPPAWTALPDSGSGSMHSFQAFVGNLSSAFMRLKVTVPLSPIEQLGSDIFFDNTLSNPAGLSCAGCHSPAAGFTGPNSAINLSAGPVPGAVAGRAGFRKPQALGYSTFSPSGPYFDSVIGIWSGGNFWDGRAPTNAAQALMPLIGPNEMANVPVVGPYPPHAGGYSPALSQKLAQASYAALFQQVFGANVFQAGNEAAVYAMATKAIAAYEASEEVNPFNSKYDASVNAVPPSNAYTFTASEQNGMQLFFGKAQCSACHSSVALDSVSSVTGGREVFSMYCYANIGVPKNPNNPYYQETDSTNNPEGYNPQGTAFIDYGLGANPNPTPGGVQFYSSTPGDIDAFRGVFKAPSLRNVDLRPSPNFVKSYMHNGVFKSLEDVVHFYNKRNIAVDSSGNEVVFDLRFGPPSGYTPLFAPPEVLDNVQNVTGAAPGSAQLTGDGGLVESNGQVGSLGLSADEETDLVNFLKTLTDGFSGSPGQ